MVCDLPISQILNHLPFDLCHLPFELFVVFTFTHGHFARSALRGIDPSPVALRLMKTPECDTLSPRERAVSSLWTPGVYQTM